MNRRLKNTDLKDALAAAEAELITVVKRAESLREWIAVTNKLCAKNSRSVAAEAEVALGVRRRTKSAGLIQNVIEVLQAAESGSLHVDDILKKLAENNHPVTAKNPKATIAVLLTRRTDQFRKTGPNTFGLASGTPLKETVIIAS